MTSELISFRCPNKLKAELDRKQPDPVMRNHVIKALINKYVKGEVDVKSYEIELVRST